MQTLEEEIKQSQYSLTTISLQRHGLKAELTNLLRSRTELECVVEDLKAANERTGGKRDEIEAELTKVKKEITQKEKALAKLLPKWEQHRARESDERRK